MLNACDTQQSFYELLGLTAFAFGSMFQYFRWYEGTREGTVQVRPVQYALDMPTFAPYLDDSLHLVVSLHPKGGAPWLTFPLDIHRRHIERLYDVCITRGLPPTEDNILVAGQFARTELQAMKMWALQKGLAYETRAGRNSGWLWNKAGEKRLIHAYFRLQGKYVLKRPSSPVARPRPIPR